MNHTIKYWLFFSIGIYLLLQSCNDDKSLYMNLQPLRN